MNLLITGGAGFIGSNFAHYWMNKYPKDNIVVLDKLTYAGRQENLDDLFDKPNFKFIPGDTADYGDVGNIVKEEKVDVIVHFAAETHVDRSIDSPEPFIHNNIGGTYGILEVARKNPEIRLHHISTDEVFGDLPLDKPEELFTENSPYNPSSPYAASKASADILVNSYIRTFGIQATISNCSNNFGPNCFPEKLIPLAITRAMMDQDIPVYGSGKQVRDWIHTEDHARGIELILNKGKLGETYLLGGDGERENIYVIKKILEYLDKPESLIKYTGDRKGHDVRYAIDFSKAKDELGFEPERSFEDRLKETVDWYKENKDWWMPLKGEADKMAEKYLSKSQIKHSKI